MHGFMGVDVGFVSRLKHACRHYYNKVHCTVSQKLL